MTFDEIKSAWLAAKEGVLEEGDLEFVKAEPFRGRQWLFYRCPCGGEDHYAMRDTEEEGLSQHPSAVLNCFASRKQWLVRPHDAAALIRGEEEKYLDLLRRAPDLVRKAVNQRGWSDETATFLAETHGVDRELSEMILSAQR